MPSDCPTARAESNFKSEHPQAGLARGVLRRPPIAGRDPADFVMERLGFSSRRYLHATPLVGQALSLRRPPRPPLIIGSGSSRFATATDGDSHRERQRGVGVHAGEVKFTMNVPQFLYI